MRIKFNEIPFFEPRFGLDMTQDILQELRALDINNLESLNTIIPSDFINRLIQLPTPQHGINISRLITHILIINDSSDYFGRAWQNRFNQFDSYDHLVFEEFKINMGDFPEEIVFDCKRIMTLNSSVDSKKKNS